jgi:hypothetical protein
VDIKAEATVSLNPYQFGNNNPVIFNDPLGDMSNLNGQEGRMRKGADGNYHVGWYNDLLWGGIDGDFGTRGDGESYESGGGGGGGGGGKDRDENFTALNLLELLLNNTPHDEDKNFYDIKYECFNVYYKNEFVGFVEKIFFGEYKSVVDGKDVQGVELILGFKNKSDKFKEFNWVQNVITTHILKDKKESGEFVYRDGYYYYADYTKGNKPYYNASWNYKLMDLVNKNSKFNFFGNYTTVFKDSPSRETSVKNGYWLASLSLVANTKNGHETLTNFYYGFQTDGNAKLKLINFGQSAANFYWFTNYLLGLKF